MLTRKLDLVALLERSSHFLLGPRGTGKSTLIRATCEDVADYIDLLDSRVYLRLKADPSLLHALTTKPYVVIDEIQRIPELLNEVHRSIELDRRRFLLTGSSARALRRQGVNLLAGRAFRAEFFPLTWRELSQAQTFDLQRYVRFGGLPSAYLGAHPEEYLYAYVDTYLKEEIQMEGHARSLPSFSRFLQNAAFNSARLLNYTKLANDAQLPVSTVRDYYQILKDTLVGFELAPWSGTSARKPVQSAKFYLFDPGVVHALKETVALEPTSDAFGMSFEHFIACELRAYLSYARVRLPLRFWRTHTGQEVDFVIGERLAVEVKSSERVSRRDQRGLVAISKEGNWQHRILVSQDTAQTTYENGVQHLHWQTFLERLWQGEYG